MSDCRRLLLLSNSKNFGGQFLAHAEDAIRSFLGSRITTVAFVPFAAVTISWDDYAARVRERLAEWGYSVASLHTAADPAAVLRTADAVLVGGGNTFQLLNELYRRELPAVLRAEVLAGKPYIGWSAGSNIAAPTIRTTNDMPIAEPPSLAALNLVPFQINPHYLDERPAGHQGETRAERLREFIQVNRDVWVVGLPEGTLLELDRGRLRLVGKKPLRLFRYGREERDLPPGSDLTFLIRSV